MKISHRDFRPPRRSKYVTQPLKRRPTFRILLLAGIGLAVYLKFDTVVSSRAFQSLRKPKEIISAFSRIGNGAPERHADPIALKWSVDSGGAEADCPSARLDSCLRGLAGMDPEALGSLRAAIQKVEWQWDAAPIAGFSAHFLRNDNPLDLLHPKETALELSRLDLPTAKGILQLIRKPGKEPAPLCTADRCLDEVHPQTPFTHYRSAASLPLVSADQDRIPGAVFIPEEGASAKAILPGRVIALPKHMEQDWLEIYHGANLFSFYRGFSRLRAGLKAGSRVGIEDTLGFLSAPADSAAGIPRDGRVEAGLEMRIVKDGSSVDPIAWLEAEAQSEHTGMAHGH